MWWARARPGPRRKAFRLAYFLFGLAEGEVFRRETPEWCDHWWHRNLTDTRVREDLLRDPNYVYTSMSSDAKFHGRDSEAGEAELPHETGLRLVDEFRAEVSVRGCRLPGELEECGCFGDLMWSPNGGGFDLLRRMEEDPAFEVVGYSRWVAFARICNEVRFYAGPLPQGAWDWYWSGEYPERVAALDAEPDVNELGVLPSPTAAVTFAVEYLGGTPLKEIDVRRITLQRSGPTQGGSSRQ